MSNLLPQPIFETDAKGNITFINRTAQKHFSKSIYHPIFHASQLAATSYVEKFESAIRSILKNGEKIRNEYLFKNSDNVEYPVVVHAHPIMNNNEITGVRGTFFDLTQIKEAESTKNKLIKELGNKNAELERFTYTVSHDLKSPLITIKGFLGLLTSDARKGNVQRMESDIKKDRKCCQQNAEPFGRFVGTLPNRAHSQSTRGYFDEKSG